MGFVSRLATLEFIARFHSIGIMFLRNNLIFQCSIYYLQSRDHWLTNFYLCIIPRRATILIINISEIIIIIYNTLQLIISYSYLPGSTVGSWFFHLIDFTFDLFVFSCFIFSILNAVLDRKRPHPVHKNAHSISSSRK